jgi:hypothetical protein
MAGACAMTTHGSRAVGTRSRASRVKRPPRLESRVSMIGLAPATVTVSSTADTSSVTFTSALKPISTLMSSRTRRENPANSNATL